MQDKIAISLRIPTEMKAWLASKARENERSVNAQIILALRNAMRADEPTTTK